MKKLLVILIICITYSSKANPFQDYEWRLPINVPVRTITLSDDNTKMIVASTMKFWVYDLKNDSLISTIDFDGYTFNNIAFFINDEKLLLYDTWKIYVYDLKEMKKIKPDLTNNEFTNSSPALSPTKDKFAYFNNNVVYIYNLESEKITHNLEFNFSQETKPDDIFSDLTFSKDGKHVIAMTGYGFVAVWEINSGEMINKFDLLPNEELPNPNAPFLINWFDENTFVSNVYYGIWNFKTGEKIKQINSYLNYQFNLSNDRRYVVDPYRHLNKYYIDIYDLIKSERVKSFQVNHINDGNIEYNVGIISDKKEIVSEINDIVCRYNFEETKISKYITVPYIGDKKISPDNQYLYVLNEFNLCRIKANTGEIDYFLNPHDVGSEKIRPLAINNECTKAVISTTDLNSNKHLKVVNLDTRKVEFSKPYEFDKEMLFKFSYDDKYLGIINQHNINYIKIIETGNYDTIDSVHINTKYRINNIEFSKNNDEFMFWYRLEDPYDYSIKIRNYKNKEYICEFINHAGAEIFKYDNNNNVIGNIKHGKYLHLFEPCANEDPEYLLGFPSFIISLILSYDSRYMIGFSEYNEMIIFDLKTKEKIGEYNFGSYAWGKTAAISRNNQYVAIPDGNYLYYTRFNNLITSVEISNKEKSNLKFYPQPCENLLNIKNININTNSLEIYNLLGIKVAEQSITSGREKIDVSSLPAGMYFLKAGDQVRKFVKR